MCIPYTVTVHITVLQTRRISFPFTWESNVNIFYDPLRMWFLFNSVILPRRKRITLSFSCEQLIVMALIGFLSFDYVITLIAAGYASMPHLSDSPVEFSVQHIPCIFILQRIIVTVRIDVPNNTLVLYVTLHRNVIWQTFWMKRAPSKLGLPIATS